MDRRAARSYEFWITVAIIGLLVIGTTLIVIQADFTDLFFDIKFNTGNCYTCNCHVKVTKDNRLSRRKLLTMTGHGLCFYKVF